MVEGIWWLWEWLDVWWDVRQDVNKVGEEARKKAQEDQAKAKKVWQQIKQSKQENNNLAQFLAFLLKSIKSDKILSLLYNTFFKTKDIKKWVTYIRKDINNIVVVWFFAPFFPDEIKQYNLNKYYDELIKFEVLNLHNYVWYIKLLARKYHDNIPVDPQTLINLVIEISLYFELQKQHRELKDEEDLRKFMMKNLLKK